MVTGSTSDPVLGLSVFRYCTLSRRHLDITCTTYLFFIWDQNTFGNSYWIRQEWHIVSTLINKTVINPYRSNFYFSLGWKTDEVISQNDPQTQSSKHNVSYTREIHEIWLKVSGKLFRRRTFRFLLKPSLETTLRYLPTSFQGSTGISNPRTQCDGVPSPRFKRPVNGNVPLFSRGCRKRHTCGIGYDLIYKTLYLNPKKKN